MTTAGVKGPVATADYPGRILTGDFSPGLKKHVAQFIRRFQRFDETGCPALPYIAAWRDTEKIIWYEFVSQRFLSLLDCEPADAAGIFRQSVVQRRSYRYRESDRRVRKDILSRRELKGRRNGLRQEVEKQGIVEAVYQSLLPGHRACWFKDQAFVELFPDDGVILSPGCLTVVTKIMENEEHLLRTREALKKSEEKFRDLAVHDPLTGLYNTRYLYQSLSRLVAESAADHPFSLIFTDIDDFKQVVDTHGHLNASQTLQEVAATIRSSLTEPAYGVAYGGDEFVIVLPGSGKRRALQVADSIRLKVRRSTYLGSKGLAVKIKASFGVATFPQDAASLSDVLALADQAMFSVKKRGKDSVSGASRVQDPIR